MCILEKPKMFWKALEAINIRLQPNNINRESGIEIPEAWIPTIKKHNCRSTTKRTNNNEDEMHQ